MPSHVLLLRSGQVPRMWYVLSCLPSRPLTLLVCVENLHNETTIVPLTQPHLTLLPPLVLYISEFFGSVPSPSLYLPYLLPETLFVFISCVLYPLFSFYLPPD